MSNTSPPLERRREEPEVYSLRKVFIGSKRAARLAGRKLALMETMKRSKPTAPKVAGSVTETSSKQISSN